MTVLLADPQDLTRAGLRHYAAVALPGAAVEELRDTASLTAALGRSPEAVVVMDYALLELRGVEAVERMLQRWPLARWVVVTGQTGRETLRRLMVLEGVGVALKESTGEELLRCLRAAAEGSRHLAREVVQSCRATLEGRREQLTASETDILCLIAHGLTVKQIAERRHSSQHTIVAHKKNLFRKLDVSNVYEATRYALQAGLVDLMEYYI